MASVRAKRRWASTSRRGRTTAQLVLTVSDDGPGSAEGALQRRGVGLTNTEHRLKALYGGAGPLLVERRAPRGVRVTVALPFHGEEAECD